MLEVIPLKKVGPTLSQLVKDSPFTLREIGEKVLSIHYTNVTKRMNANNISLKEIDKLASYLGLRAGLMISKDGEEARDSLLNVTALQAQIIQLQSETIELKRQLQECQSGKE